MCLYFNDDGQVAVVHASEILRHIYAHDDVLLAVDYSHTHRQHTPPTHTQTQTYTFAVGAIEDMCGGARGSRKYTVPTSIHAWRGHMDDEDMDLDDLPPRMPVVW
jgi:hypothetical protein